MDILQAIVTSVAVMVIVLLMALFVCHYFGPRATAWIRSNREEKIGLSKNRLYNANGYLIQSSTEFLVGSSGSFKRFDSVDRDCKELQDQQTSVPLWNIPINDIPPQPLRPAPSSPSAIVSPKAQIAHQQRPPKSEARPIKQQSMEQKTVSASMAIPRPVTRRQLSTPISSSPFSPLLNVPGSMHKTNCAKKSMSTNPFLNESLGSTVVDNQVATGVLESINPFEVKKVSGDSVAAANKVETESHLSDVFTFDTTKINELLLMEEENTTVKNALLEAEGSIKKLESVTLDDRKHRQDYEEFLRQQNELNWNKVRESSKKKNPPIRNRSLSETEASAEKKLSQSPKDPAVPSTNPFVTDSSIVLHKTASENYLQQYSGQVMGIRSTRAMQNAWGLSKEKTKRNISGSQSSLSESEVSTVMSNENLYRAVSCESVSSQSSVVLADLEEPTIPSVTGYLCIGLHYDKNTISDEGVELIVTVLEAKELVGPPDAKFMDTFVRIYLVPDETGASQTKLFKDSSCPSYNETFSFFMSNKHTRRSLWFHLYHSGMAHTLIGEAEMQLSDLSARPITTWLTLSDSRHNKSCNWGELMICLSYLPTAERLTVVVVKARNLRIDQKMQDVENVFVKVYLLKDDRKVSKKKTSTKRKEKSPIYNESMIFSVPPYMLSSIQVRLTVAHQLENDASCVVSLGHVILGSAATGKGLRHWNQMISSVRKPVAMWHPLRRPALPRHQLQTTKTHS
ncbi:synaptotagmin 1 [Lutzomyia longipalpis]|uniref:synaptotagmin 1 n=1 Tax=Lutzomyia longipalpis TaxID=7200 RepID=UPI0024836C15|nr:synaptotagmin 1 [Lutzomyia longipalpis]